MSVNNKSRIFFCLDRSLVTLVLEMYFFLHCTELSVMLFLRSPCLYLESEEWVELVFNGKIFIIKGFIIVVCCLPLSPPPLCLSVCLSLSLYLCLSGPVSLSPFQPLPLCDHQKVLYSVTFLPFPILLCHSRVIVSSVGRPRGFLLRFNFSFLLDVE